ARRRSRFVVVLQEGRRPPGCHAATTDDPEERLAAFGLLGSSECRSIRRFRTPPVEGFEGLTRGSPRTFHGACGSTTTSLRRIATRLAFSLPSSSFRTNG